MTVYWTPEMLAKLRELREANTPLYECAERIGVSYTQAVHKAQQLGLNARRNRGRIPGCTIVRPESVLEEKGLTHTKRFE